MSDRSISAGTEGAEGLEDERDVDGAGQHRRQPAMAGGGDDRVVEAAVGLVDQAHALDRVDVDGPPDSLKASAAATSSPSSVSVARSVATSTA